MKIVKIKDGMDSDTFEGVLGYYFKKAFENGEWSQRDIDNNLNKFKNGQWGAVSSKTAELNNKHLEEEKGNLTGIYPKDGRKENDMIIFYSEYNNCIYILSSFDFQTFEEAWIIGEDKYLDEYGNADKRSAYKEHGHQLKKEQKEYFRQMFPDFDEPILPEDLKKEYDTLNKKYKRNPDSLTKEEIQRFREIKKIREENEYKKSVSEGVSGPEIKSTDVVLQPSRIEEVKKVVESGSNGIPSNAKKVLEDLAKKHNVDYMDLIEKIGEEMERSNATYSRAYASLLKNIEYPFYFADSKPEWLDDELIEDIIYSKEWPTTIKEIADSLVSHGLKKTKDAVHYVKQYLRDNPHDKKHFKDEFIQPRIIKKDEPQYDNFEIAASLMTEENPKHRLYFVDDVYFDLGQYWMWTTIVTTRYQALNPRQWKQIYNANSPEEIQNIVDEIFAEESSL